MREESSLDSKAIVCYAKDCEGRRARIATRIEPHETSK